MSDVLRHNHSRMTADDRSFRLICESIRKRHGELLESMPDGIVIIDTSGRIVLVNSQAEKLFGYGRGDLVSMMIEELVPAHLRKGHVGQRNSYLANPVFRSLGRGQVLFGVRQDDVEVPVEISLSPMQTDDGLLICAAVRDVSERVRVEKALRASEEQVRSQVLEERYFDLYANSPDMCASIDAATGRIVDCNNTLAEATGYTREELLAMPHVSNLYDPECEDARVDVFRDFEETGTVRDAELQLICNDGGIIDVSLSLTAVRGENGNVVRSRSVWRDITSRRRSEKMLRLIVEGTSLSFGEDYFRSLTRHLANALDVRCAFVSEIPKQRGGQLRLLAFWNGNDFEQNFEYHVQGTPCEHVIEQGLVYYPDNVRQLFPEDQWLKGSDIESYLAVALQDLDGNSVGVMGIAHAEPLSFPSDAQSILQVSSMRASAELLRMRAEMALHQAHNELEMRVSHRTADLEEANRRLEGEVAARKKSEELLLAAQSAAKVGVWELDLLTNLCVCSDEYYQIHGRQPKDSAPTLEQQLDWIHPGDRDSVSNVIQNALDDNVPFESDFRVIWPDGTIHWLVCKGKVVRDDAGRPVRMLGATFDVTERMLIEDALRASEEQVRLILDSTAEAIYGLDLQGNCTFCNQACVETLGYERTEELLGQNMHDLIHHTRVDGSHYPMQECRIYETFRLGVGTHVDDEVLWKADGSSFPATYRSIPVRRDGELVGSVVTFLDITEQQRVAEALRTQQAELTHAARLSTLGEMAAALAHELNQPLTAMSAFAEGALVRLDRGKLKETEVAPIFSRIAEDAQRAGEVIRRLRNFVQKREAQRRSIDVNRLVREVSKFVEADAKQHDVTIELELGSGLPPVEADPIEIQQVLLNLVRNACDALARDGANEPRIVISTCERHPDVVEIIVEDSGPGISDGMAEQVFEPFFTSKADGLGIGLGICKHIIEAHRGKIWFGKSSLGGAGVHFDLPTLQQEKMTHAL
ncbi:MAG: PAS domain S-box protein [Planctomycetaceae bacterium]|jgi:PAS domain S-box-containing protein|nr:PAS domain S-box protein [Planctomycetaceae bacterium]MBT6484015.1 PAS domain S-box protein [Planctomycetaceae bacterium]MBT6495484.1 PAS domain S-box protein [Planctomycetaceae bacterium]